MQAEEKHLTVLVEERKISNIKIAVGSAIELLKNRDEIKALTYLLNEVEESERQVYSQREKEDRLKDLETKYDNVSKRLDDMRTKAREMAYV